MDLNKDIGLGILELGLYNFASGQRSKTVYTLGRGGILAQPVKLHFLKTSVLGPVNEPQIQDASWLKSWLGPVQALCNISYLENLQTLRESIL